MKIIGCFFLITVFISGPFAFARRRSAPRAYSFIEEAGKASQGECDGEGKVPRKLKHIKTISKSGSYLGSELEESEPKAKANEEMWKHFFRDKSSCNAVLAKTPSSLSDSQKDKKPELPPDDSTDDSTDADTDSDGGKEGASDSP